MGWEPPPALPQARPGRHAHALLEPGAGSWQQLPPAPASLQCPAVGPAALRLPRGKEGPGDPVNEPTMQTDTFGTEAPRAPRRGRGAHWVPCGLPHATSMPEPIARPGVSHRDPTAVQDLSRPCGAVSPWQELPCRTGVKLSPGHPPKEPRIFAIHSQTLWPPALDLPGNPTGCDAGKSFIAL